MKVKVLVAQLCPTLCDSMDCLLPDSSVHGILQARILEWVAPVPLPGDLPDPGIKPRSPELQTDSLLSESLGKPLVKFSRLSRNIPLDHNRVWLLVPLRAECLVEISVRWFPLASRELSLECLGTLIIAKMPSNIVAYNEARVRTGHGTTDWFQVGKGVHQGCILSPFI